MSRIYMKAKAPDGNEMYAVGRNKQQVTNAWKIGEFEGQHVIMIACSAEFAAEMQADPDCLGGNSADLALRFPEIAKQVLMVDVELPNGSQEQVPFGDVSQGMSVISPAKPPIEIAGELEQAL